MTRVDSSELAGASVVSSVDEESLDERIASDVDDVDALEAQTKDTKTDACAVTSADGDAYDMDETRRASMLANLDEQSVRDRMEELDSELRSTISSDDTSASRCAFDRSTLRLHDDDDVSDEEMPMTLTDIQKKISAHFDGIARQLDAQRSDDTSPSTDFSSSRDTSAESESVPSNDEKELAVGPTTALDQLVDIIVSGRADIDSTSQDSASKRDSSSADSATPQTSSSPSPATQQLEQPSPLTLGDASEFKFIGTMGEYMIIGKHIEEMQGFELEPARSLEQLARLPLSALQPVASAQPRHATLPPLERHEAHDAEASDWPRGGTLPRPKKTSTWFSSLRRKKHRKEDESPDARQKQTKPQLQPQPTAHNKQPAQPRAAHSSKTPTSRGEHGDDVTAASTSTAVTVYNPPHPRKRTKLCTIV